MAANRDKLFAGKIPWKNSDEELGLSRFIYHTERLASFYGWNEADQFVRAFGLLFAGIPYDEPLAQAAWDSRHGPSLPFLKEGREGFASRLVEVGDDPAHHYAGQFWLGYFYGPGVGLGVSFARDIDTLNWPDIVLGNIAVGHALAINQTSLRIPFTGIGLVGAPYRHRLLPSLMWLELRQL